MSEQESGESSIPNREYRLQGLPAARFAEELEKLAYALRHGHVSHLEGGMCIQPVGNRIRITSDLELLVIAGKT